MKITIKCLFALLLLNGAVAFAQAPAEPAEGLPEAAKAAETPGAKLTSPIADATQAAKAREALDAFIQAYERGDFAYAQGKIDIAMIGYQRFLDGLKRDQTLLKQIRVHLFDTQVLAGPDVAVIQTGWEKRFLSAPSLTPGIFSGRSTFLMHRKGDEWRMAAFSGDNLFSSQSGALASLTVSPGVIATGGLKTISIDLVDPDLVGLAALQIEIVTNKGDRETPTLTSVSPGRFTGTINAINTCTPCTSGNGIVDYVLSTGTTITVRYLDQNPGSGRPSSYVSRVIPVN